MTLRVLLDATAIPRELTGVGHYVVNLIRELAGLEDLELHVTAKPTHLELLRREASPAHVHAVDVRTRPARLRWEQTRLAPLGRRLGAQVIHSPHYTIPIAGRIPKVVTFHDPTFLTNPELHERLKVAFFRRMIPLAARRATRIIAVSEYSRRAVIEHAGAEPDRVDVVHLGVDRARYTPGGDPDADERLRASLGVRSPYLFWVGTIEPRKNVPGLLTAFSSLVVSGMPDTLVLAGKAGWGRWEGERSLARDEMARRLVLTGYVTEAQKIALYRGARALVYPSLMEGFGLQVLEAMACGCPVITTTRSAPQEVGGDAVDLVEPGDPEALEKAIRRLVDDPRWGDELRRRGLQRVRSFGWDRTARETLQTYRLAA